MIYSWGADWNGLECEGEDVRKHRLLPRCASLEISRGLPADTRIAVVASGEAHSLFLSTCGDVFACGRAREGQLGLGKQNTVVKAPTLVESLRPHFVTRIAAGSKHSVALTSGGLAFEWGMLLPLERAAADRWASRRGGLGKDFQEDLNEKQQRIVASSWKHYLQNTNADDGDSEEEDNSSMLAFERADFRRFAAREPRAVRGAPGRAVAAACGFAHSILARDDGHLVAAGYGEKGQLGNGQRYPSAQFQLVDLGGSAAAVSSSSLAAPGESPALLACGHNHTAAVVQPSGSLLVWGHGVFGQLGCGHEHKECCWPQAVKLPGRVAQVACGDYHTLALTAGGELFSFGHRDAVGGQSHSQRLPQPVRAVADVEQIYAGGSVCFVRADAGGVALHSWGNNQHGVLGRFTRDTMLVPGPVSLPRALPQPHALGIGTSHCVAVCEPPASCVLPSDTPGPFLGRGWLRAALQGEVAYDVRVSAGREVCGAHRAVLAARCPALADQLVPDGTGEGFTLDLSSHSVVCVTALLEYLYTDFCRPSADAISGLLPLSKSLQLPRLTAGLAGAGTASSQAGTSWVKAAGGGWKQMEVDESLELPESHYLEDLQAMVCTQAPEEPLGYVALTIQDGDGERRSAAVARCLLLSLDFFRALLEGGFAESQCFQDGQALAVSAECADALLRCLQLVATGATGELRQCPLPEVLSILVEAHRLCLPELVAEASAVLAEAVAAGEAVEGLADAVALFSLPHLDLAAASVTTA